MTSIDVDPEIPTATVLVAETEVSKQPHHDLREEQPKTQKKRIFLWVLVASLITLAAVGGAVTGAVLSKSSDDGAEKPKSTSNADALQQNTTNGNDLDETEEVEEEDEDEEDCPSSSLEDSGNEERFLKDKDFWSIGCFLSQASVDSHPLVEGSVAEQADACHNLCITQHFGVADNTCYCYVEVPQQRLAVGSCNTACGTPVAQRMEAYVNLGGDTECNQPATTSVRNFLVEEDDAPFGFDLIQNTYRPSPFELFKEECGTNMYEVQTEVNPA